METETKLGKLNRRQAAELIGVSPAMLSLVLSGQRGFSKKTAQLAANAFGQNVTIFLFGSGEQMKAAMGIVDKVADRD